MSTDLTFLRADAQAARERYANHATVAEYDAHALAGAVLTLLSPPADFPATDAAPEHTVRCYARIHRLTAELSALRAALDAVAEALRPALEAEAGATGGEWRATNGGGGLARRPVWHLVDAGERGFVVCRTGTENMPRAKGDAALIAASVNAVRALAALPAVRAALEGVSL